MKRSLILSISILIITAAGSCRPTQESAVYIHVASSAAPAVSEISHLFEEETGIKVRLNHAASSVLARQIGSGAPADMFLSATPSWMKFLDTNGDHVRETIPLLYNRLVVVIPAGTETEGNQRSLPDVPIDTLTDGRIAMGDPAHVPAGIYAKQSLQHLGWYAAIENRLAPCPNARAALRLVEQKEVTCGVVYQSDAITSKRVSIVKTLPKTSHDPIIYPLGRLNLDSSDSRQFFYYLQNDKSKAVFRKYGFTTNDKRSLEY